MCQKWSMTQALEKASPSPFQAMAHGLLVPSAKSWNSRVRGLMRYMAQVKSKVLPFWTTWAGLKTPFQP